MSSVDGQLSILDYIHKGAWYKNRGILTLNLLLLIPLVTSVVNGLDSSLINGLQISPDWQDYFNHPRGKTLGILNSAQFIGNLIALPFTPYASDIYGRRAALFFGAVIMCVGVGLQAAAWSIPMFIGARFAIGFGLAFCQNAAPLLLIELSYPTQRGRITAIYNSSWYFGSIVSAWVCFGTFNHASGSQWSWRIPTLVQALCPLAQIISVWFMPESPRWLVSKGMESRAAAILAKYHAHGSNERDPLVMFEMAQIRHAIRLEEEINRTTTFWSLFTTPGNRRRMRIILGIAVFSQWSGNGVLSYYINLVLESVGIMSTNTKSVVNGCLQTFDFIIAIAASLSIDYIGRRPLFLVSTVGMLATYCACTLTNALYSTVNDLAAAKATIPLIFLFFFFYNMAYSPVIITYALEILPFRIRAKGFAVMNLTMMATIAFNDFVNPWALGAIHWKYYLVYCGWLAIELVFVFFFIVETKGRTLEETAAMFDGGNQREDLLALGGEAARMTVRINQIVEQKTDDDQIDAYYSMKKRDRDSDTASSTDFYGRAL